MKTRIIVSIAAITALAVSSAGIALAGGGHHQKQLERLDTNKDGVIEKSELETHRLEIFAKIDADSNGSLTTEELKQAHEARRAKHAERRDSAKRWKRMLERLDTNNDGAISKSEASKMPERRFDKIDADQDGVITEAEATAAASKHRERRAAKGRRAGNDERAKNRPQAKGDRSARRMAKLDTNSDGEISQDEFTSAPHRLMKLDTNNDGKIDATELAARKQRKGKRGGKRRGHGK